MASPWMLWLSVPGFPACSSRIAMAASPKVSEQALSQKGFNATCALRHRENVELPFPYQKSSSHASCSESLKPACLCCASAQICS